MKHQKKVLFNSIKGISDQSVHRIGYAAGIKRMGSDVPDVVKKIMKVKIEEIISKATNIMNYTMTKTLSKSDVSYSIVPNMWTKQTKDVKSCQSNSTSSNKEIMSYRETSGCFHFYKAPFRRLVKEIGQDYRSDMSYSEEALNLIQFSVESYLIALLKAAAVISESSSRATLFSTDVHTTLKVFDILVPFYV